MAEVLGEEAVSRAASFALFHFFFIIIIIILTAFVFNIKHMDASLERASDLLR